LEEFAKFIEASDTIPQSGESFCGVVEAVHESMGTMNRKPIEMPEYRVHEFAGL